MGGFLGGSRLPLKEMRNIISNDEETCCSVAHVSEGRDLPFVVPCSQLAHTLSCQAEPRSSSCSPEALQFLCSVQLC